MFIKTAHLALAILLLLPLTLTAAPPEGTAPPEFDKIVDNSSYITGNNILMFVTNHGNFGRDIGGIFGYGAGTFYPFNTIAEIQSGTLDNYILYAAGLWMIGNVGGDIRAAISEYSSQYVPGPMSGGTYLPDDPAFKVYHLYSDSLEDNPNDDYTDWPADQGAPVDRLGNPLMIGDEMVWAVFNDADPSHHQSSFATTDPLGVEVQLTAWTLNGPTPYGQTIYLKYKLLNKGSNSIDDCYIGLWFDPDIGGANDDLVGCDTLDNLFFAYNGDGDDTDYGSDPPAVGCKLLRGPVVPSVGDTAFFDGFLIPDYVNLGMSAFNAYINGTDPNDITETYNYMQGLNADGTPLANGTTFMFPGDPVAMVGDYDTAPSDKRMMGICGPISQFYPGDSQFVMAVFTVGDASTYLTSLTALRNQANSLYQGMLFDEAVYLDEDTLHAYTANAIDPVPAVLYAGNFDGLSPEEIIQIGGITVNGDIFPTNLEVVNPPFPGFNGRVIRAEFDLRELVQDYLPFYDVTEQEFTFDYSGGSITGTAVMQGHISGDVNLDGIVNISDIIYLIQYRFHGGPAPRIFELADVNLDGTLNLLDIIYLIDYKFRDGDAPLHP